MFKNQKIILEKIEYPISDSKRLDIQFDIDCNQIIIFTIHKNKFSNFCNPNQSDI